MQRRFAQLQKKWAKRGMVVGLGIGINRGPVVLGHIGGKAQMTYSMIGQTVNIGHRLVEIAEDGQIIVVPQLLEDGLPEPNGVEVANLSPRSVKGTDELVPMVMLKIKQPPRRRKDKHDGS
jgi:class 3 adenylate cyclase